LQNYRPILEGSQKHQRKKREALLDFPPVVAWRPMRQLDVTNNTKKATAKKKKIIKKCKF
jgi:hypothetical protein